MMMKKFTMIVLLAAGALSVAASLNVPWFVDNARANAPIVGRNTRGFIAVHNNHSATVTCTITYYDGDGTSLNGNGADGDATRPYNTVWSTVNNDFTIGANATVTFRPVKHDPAAGTFAGQELATGALVPNRPKYGAAGTATNKDNGSCKIEWATGGGVTASTVQGAYTEAGVDRQSSYLLPAGQ